MLLEDICSDLIERMNVI